MQGKRAWSAQLMASVFEKEATYNAGKTHTSSTSCSFNGFEFDPGYDDKMVSDIDEINGREFGYDQQIMQYGNNPKLGFNRVRPNDFAAFAALVLGSTTPYQDAALAAYRHHIVPITGDAALPSISMVHSIGGVQTEYKGVIGNSLKLSGSEGGFLKMDVGLIASGLRATNAAAFAAWITESWLKVGDMKLWIESGADISISSGVAYSGNPLTELDFVDGGAGVDTLTDDGSHFVSDGFKPGMSVKITGATTSGNDVTAILTTVAAGVLTFPSGTFAGAEAGKAGMTVVGTPTQGTEDISSGTPDNLSIRGKSFEFGWDNKAKPQYGFGGGDYLQDVLYNRRSASLKMSLLAEAAVEIGYYDANTVLACEIDIKAAGLIAAGGSMYYGAQIVIPRMKISKYPVMKGGVNDLLSQDIEFEIFNDGVNPSVIIEGFCAQAAYLAAP
jgi:hypothetical protein